MHINIRPPKVPIHTIACFTPFSCIRARYQLAGGQDSKFLCMMQVTAFSRRQMWNRVFLSSYTADTTKLDAIKELCPVSIANSRRRVSIDVSSRCNTRSMEIGKVCSCN